MKNVSGKKVEKTVDQLLNSWLEGNGNCQKIILSVDTATLAAAIEIIINESIEMTIAVENLQHKNDELWQNFNQAMSMLEMVEQFNKKNPGVLTFI